MALSDILFGTKPKATITGKTTLTEEQQKLFEETVFPFLDEPIAGQPLSSTEQLSLAALEEQAIQAVSGDTAGTQAQGALGDIFSRGPTDISEFFESNIRDPLLKDFNEIILPGIGKRFAGQFFSGERAEGERSAVDDLLRTLTSERSKIALAGREQDTDAILRAAGLAPGADAGVLSNLMGLFEGGGLGRNIDRQRLHDILAALGIQTTENIGIGTGGSSGLLGGLLGGVGTGVGMAGGAALLSSEDYKTDKAPAEDVLPRLDKMRIERWRYKGGADKALHIGPYAEEFQAAFNTEDSKTIPIIDALGVALKGVQELSGKVSMLESAMMEEAA